MSQKNKLFAHEKNVKFYQVIDYSIYLCIAIIILQANEETSLFGNGAPSCDIGFRCS